MPIIKDKYKAKSTRTTPIIARNSKVDTRSNTDNFSESLNTEQLQAIATQDARNNTNIIGAGHEGSVTTNGPVITGKISAYNLTNPDLIENVFILGLNEKLNNITINYQNKYQTASTVSLFWSIYPISEINNIAADGILSTLDGKLNTLVSSVFPANTSINLQDLCQGFENLGKNIYFYGLASEADALGVTYNFLVG